MRRMKLEAMFSLLAPSQRESGVELLMQQLLPGQVVVGSMNLLELCNSLKENQLQYIWVSIRHSVQGRLLGIDSI
ncbi:hypothetical protein CDL15_Pgr014417 [Punica granatum]|uniref:Uncharacterized protein n=1 Tax=Punica granatum TaxID=22663 RepID=A0A218WCZ7_PUNGR|nr:hypothetical protein CDL15_Pgr014417 [Punica granatum]